LGYNERALHINIVRHQQLSATYVMNEVMIEQATRNKMKRGAGNSMDIVGKGSREVGEM
jgi:hypothetical protein